MMQAFVYKSLRQADTFLYLARADDFAVLPTELGGRLSPFQFVLDVELTPTRTLAQVDAGQVRAQLAERGWFLQMPPRPAFDPLTFDHGTDA